MERVDVIWQVQTVQVDVGKDWYTASPPCESQTLPLNLDPYEASRDGITRYSGTDFVRILVWREQDGLGIGTGWKRFGRSHWVTSRQWTWPGIRGVGRFGNLGWK